MESEAPRHPLRDVLRGGDDADALDLLSGIVTQVQTSTAPYGVKLRLADGTITDWLPYLAWWSPRVNDVAQVIRKGPALHVLGAYAPAVVVTSPHRHDAADVDGTIIAAAPAPGTPAPPPAAAPTRRTVGVAPTDRAYWSPWGWRREELVQGGANALRTFWFYGTGIAAVKGSGTIVAGTLYLQRVSSYHGATSANVRLGVHNAVDASGSGGAAHTSVAVVRQLARGQDATVNLTPAQIAELNAGKRGLGLEPGSLSYSSSDYLRAVANSASGQLALTIEG